MVIVLDDIIYGLQRSGGVSAYWSELSRRVASEAPFHLDFNKNGTNIFATCLDPAADRILSGSRLPLGLHRYLPVATSLSVPHVFHSSYYRYTTNRYGVNVTTFHDFVYERFRTGLPRFVHHLQKAAAVAHSKGIICVSEATARDFRRFFPEYPGLVRVIYNGVSSDYYPIPETTRKQRVLFIGSRAYYKNFDAAVAAVALLPRYELLLVGGGELTKVERAGLNARLSGRYVHRQRVENAQLNILYNESHCLLYPSSYEGFGIPVVEAMKAGCPVVVGRAPVFREIAEDAGVYLNSTDPAEIARSVTLLETDAFRRELTAKGKIRSGRFSWDAAARETLEFYKETLQKFN